MPLAAPGWPDACVCRWLKSQRTASDGLEMFSAEERPGVPAGASLRNLHFSMNAPVVAIEALPVGPARAAIALFAGEASSCVALAVRSLRAERTVFFVSGDDLDPSGEPEIALEAGFSFAERMGFLFDEDEVESGGEADTESARERWQGFHGVDLPDESPRDVGLPAPDRELRALREGAGGPDEACDGATGEARLNPMGAAILSKFRLGPGVGALAGPRVGPATLMSSAAAEASFEAAGEPEQAPELRLLLLSRF
jgi:hypothetical protein